MGACAGAGRCQDGASGATAGLVAMHERRDAHLRGRRSYVRVAHRRQAVLLGPNVAGQLGLGDLTDRWQSDRRTCFGSDEAVP
ncbi:MAG: hypothetical protein K8H88_33715, partial [Sandaracinaceae bacterium]|nr:hypothetical protein [Sandaracinaceae bacterium]